MVKPEFYWPTEMQAWTTTAADYVGPPVTPWSPPEPSTTAGPVIVPEGATVTQMTSGKLVVVKPAQCSVNVHVWACEHAGWCKCRTAWREVKERDWCPVCGQ